MRAKEFLKEYRVDVNRLRKEAIKQVYREDEEYWLDKSAELKEKYKNAGLLPPDHPAVLFYEKRTGRKLNHATL